MKDKDVDTIIFVLLVLFITAVAIRLTWEVIQTSATPVIEKIYFWQSPPVISGNPQYDMQKILANNEIIMNSAELYAFEHGFHTPNNWVPDPGISPKIFTSGLRRTR